MTFLELAKKRYSVREFQEKSVEQEKVDAILKAAQMSPTACNFQPQKILVANDKEALEKVFSCTKRAFQAPLAFLICYDKNVCWNRPFDGQPSGTVDASIVTTHMMLEAADLGLGSVWVMSFEPDKLREEFAVPENLEVVSILVCGYAAEGVVPPPTHEDKKPLDKTVCYNHF